MQTMYYHFGNNKLLNLHSGLMWKVATIAQQGKPLSSTGCLLTSKVSYSL